MVRELAELGMALARAAANQALLEWEGQTSRAATPPASGEAQTPPFPLAGEGRGGGSPPSDTTPPGTATETQGAEPLGAGGAAAARSRPDHALAFARLSRAVRQTIALEARIAAGDLASPRRHPGASLQGEHPAGRRPFTLEGRLLDQTSDADLNRALSLGLLRDIAERLDDDPEIEPEDIATVADALRGVCGDLGIDLDPRQEPAGWPDASQPASLSPNPLPTKAPAPRLGPAPGPIGWPRDPAPPPQHAGPRPHPPGRDPPSP